MRWVESCARAGRLQRKRDRCGMPCHYSIQSRAILRPSLPPGLTLLETRPSYSLLGSRPCCLISVLWEAEFNEAHRWKQEISGFPNLAYPVVQKGS
jgi:hypothetical protein